MFQISTCVSLPPLATSGSAVLQLNANSASFWCPSSRRSGTLNSWGDMVCRSMAKQKCQSYLITPRKWLCHTRSKPFDTHYCGQGSVIDDLTGLR
eukprot:scaffold543988_cov51-Prasinocladus_malaysianus.AAC.1